MITTLRLLIFTLIFFQVTCLTAQNRQLRNADRHFELFQFSRAIDGYKEVIEQHPDNVHAIKKLADSYRLTNKFEEALIWYEKVVQYEDIDPEYYFHFAQMLRSQQMYQDAKVYYEKYFILFPGDKRAGALFEGIDEILRLIEDSASFSVRNLPINTEGAEFSPAFYKENGLVFPTSRAPLPSPRRADSWTDRSFLDLHIAYREREIHYTTPELLPGKVNQQFHEGPLTFNNDFTEMYFTRNYYDGRRTNVGRDRILKLEIFHAKFENGAWVVGKPLSFSSKEYSNAHPSLTADGKTMYYSSDMPGGFGRGDIYVVHKNTDGTWGEPQNLGTEINTEGEEAFPFIHPDGTLYFASDGRVGLGGLDIYRAIPQEEGGWVVENLGPPINSSYDDFGIIKSESKQWGYFSSNRPGGKGSDDIYRFDRKMEHFIEILVLDSLDQTPLEDATIVIYNKESGDSVELVTNAEGIAFMKIDENPKYALTAFKDKFKAGKEVEYITTGLDTSTTFKETINIYKPAPIVTVEQLITGQIIELKNLYYDFDKHHIREDAALILDEVLRVLEEYPGIQIKLLSHTDSRGSDEYNLTLSMRRAQSAMNYLLSAGIERERLSYEGFGERRPVNHCVQGVQCTDEEHQLNRRTEIEIIKGLDID